MRLRHIGIDGFGCLHNLETEFAPGLNVIYGLNEAGKSTLQQAICAMLYGFFDSERGKPEEKRRHERFRPWTDGAVSPPYRGALEYEMENGDTFEVRRDFASPDIPTQLIDLALGADVAQSFGQGRHGNVPFARRQLGMSRGVFQSCAFIAQGEVFAASQGATPREIGDAIAAMADSARRDVSASAALAQLDALMLRIGSDRARTAELPRARENLREAEAELGQIDNVRATVSERARDLEQIQARLGDLKATNVTLRAQYLLARRKSLSRRLEALREVDGTLERASAERNLLEAYESFPSELRDRVVALDDRRRGAVKRVEVARSDVVTRETAVTEATRLEFEALRLSVGQLSPESIASLERTAYSSPPIAEERRGFVSRLLRSAFEAISRLLAWALRRNVAAEPPTDSEAALNVAPIEAMQLLEKYRRYLTVRPAVEAFDGARARSQREEQALSSVINEITALLAGRAGTSLDAAVGEFIGACDKRVQFEASVLAMNEAQQRREALLSGRSQEDIERQLDDSNARLQEILDANPGLEPADGDEPTSAIEEKIKATDANRHELEIASARLEEELRGALGEQRPRADVEEDVERWRREALRLERRRHSAQIAREVIDEAMTSVYRDFAPAVSSFLSDGFAHVTQGRYQRAHVDPSTLEVSLLLPETHQVIKDPPVSRGTLSLAYLLMRIGLAQHMSSVSEPVPLVLDDPLVDLDEHRLGLTLEFIAALSERMQVLLFTKDPAVRRWLEDNAGDGRRRLHLLSSLVPAATAV